MDGETKAKTKRSQAIGGVFLMAVSAMESGSLTRTTESTNDSHDGFGLVIIALLLLSLIVQISIWRVLCVANMRAWDVASKLLSGLGYFLVIFVFVDGLIFNVDNVGGAALGLNIMIGPDLRAGYVMAGVIAVIVFSVENVQGVADSIVKILSILKILVILGAMIVVQPPMSMALKETFAPSIGVPTLFPSILTLMGGIVGGYIAFAGAYRLISGGVVDKEDEKRITKDACGDLGIVAFSRFSLSMPVFGVVVKGVSFDPMNPVTGTFSQGDGEIYYRVFGLLLFFAGITSIIDAPYTSLSFVRSLSKTAPDHSKAVTITFITCATLVVLLLGKPIALLTVAGALSAPALPLVLVISLVAAHRKDIVSEEYHHPIWLAATGIVSAILFVYFAIVGMGSLF